MNNERKVRLCPDCGAEMHIEKNYQENDQELGFIAVSDIEFNECKCGCQLIPYKLAKAIEKIKASLASKKKKTTIKKRKK